MPQTHSDKKRRVIVSIILTSLFTLCLSACKEDDRLSCVAPSYNSDGSLTVEDHLQCYQPSDLHAAYNLNPIYRLGITGLNQDIVLIDAYGSPTALADLTLFHEINFPDKTLPEINILYPFGQPDYDDDEATAWAMQTSNDIQWSHAIAPDANISNIVAVSDDTDDLLDAITYAVTHFDSGTVVSLTFTDTESNYSTDDIEAIEAILKQGTEKGLSFFSPSGTWGSDNRTSAVIATYPSSSPYVTCIGGSFLQYTWSWQPLSNTPYLDSGNKNPDYFNINPDPMQRIESVWNEAWIQAATGGGISQVFDIPDWQQNMSDIIETNALDLSQSTGRGYPDLAWHSSFNGGLFTYYDGNWFSTAGTSIGSPQVTAFFALANQYLQQQGLSPVGLLNQWLYQISDEAAFNDIQPVKQGSVLAGELINNQRFTLLDNGEVAFGDIAGYPTLVGWDLTTGFGSPNGLDF